MKIKYLIISLAIIVLGCEKNSHEDIEIIDITMGLKAKNEAFRLSRIAERIEYIFLETKEECLINNIDKIMIDDDQVFIFNKKQFFIFYTSGLFKRSIGNFGRGPGEYLRIMDFTINTDDNEIYIYDSDQKKVIVYDYEGNLIFEIKVEGYPTCITCYNNKFLYFSYVRPDFVGNDNYGISVYTLKGELLKKVFNRNEERFDPGIASTFLTRLNHYSDTLTYWEINLDIIYKIIDNDQIIPRYQIYYESISDNKDMGKIEKNTFRYSYFIETENYMFFLKGIYNNNIKHILYDKNSKISYSPYYESKNKNFSLNAGFINDIDGGYPFLPYDAITDGRLYSVIYLYEYKIKKALEKGKFENSMENNLFADKLINSKIIDNPAIMIVTLK